MNTRPVIAGIGEILWDVYPDGAHFGGAPANCACHAAGLGGDGRMVGAVGVDTAGDDALRLPQGMSLAEINRHANAVASCVCSQRGATPALPDHLRRVS